MLILASQSPRRQELLARVVSDFVTEPADIDERALPQAAPARYVQTLAQAKGRAVAAKHPTATVIAADTMVAYRDQMLGKPQDREEAAAMLTMLADQTHQVHTGLFVKTPEAEQLQVVTTEVTFWPLTPAEIAAYLDTKEYADKAGAYGIQGQGALLVKGIVGDYYNVMGLPISTLARML